jgi:hypothetical protein
MHPELMRPLAIQRQQYLVAEAQRVSHRRHRARPTPGPDTDRRSPVTRSVAAVRPLRLP